MNIKGDNNISIQNVKGNVTINVVSIEKQINDLKNGIKNLEEDIEFYNDLTDEVSKVKCNSRIFRKKEELKDKKKRLNALIQEQNSKFAERLGKIHNLDSINLESQQQPNILLALKYVIETLAPLDVVPYFILRKLYPFSAKNTISSYYSNFTFYTNNEEFYALIEKIKEGKKSIKYVTNNHKTEAINKDKEKIITFLKLHLINHIEFSDRQKGRICVHNLFENQEECNCPRCTYQRLDFAQTIEQLDTINLRNAYFYVQLGNFVAANKYYEKLAIEAKEQKEWTKYFICQYNRTKLYLLLFQNYWKKDRNDILEKLSDINLDEILLDIQAKQDFNQEIVEILKWIKNDKFIHDKMWQLDTLLVKALQYYRNDKIGGYFNDNNIVNKIINEVAEINMFLDFNFIIYNSFSEFYTIVHKTLEGLLALYQIENEKSTKLKTFSDYIINLIIFYGDAQKLKQLFNTYQISSIKCEDSQHLQTSPFLSKINNYNQSINTVVNLIKEDENRTDIKYHLLRKLRGIYQNIVILLSKLELEKNYFNQCLNIALKIYFKASALQLDVKDFTYLINNKNSDVSLKNLKTLFNIAFDTQNLHTLNLQNTTIKALHKHNYILPTVEFTKLVLDNEEENYDIATSLWKILSIEDKQKTTIMVNEKLEEYFSPKTYYISVIYGIISYEKYLPKFISLIPNDWRNETIFHSQENKDKNHLLNQFISIAYIYNIDLNVAKYQVLHNNVPYYEWLLNLETYDYSNFNPYWMLKYKVDAYFKAFAKVPTIKAKIVEAIKEKKTDGLVDIYMKYFADDVD